MGFFKDFIGSFTGAGGADAASRAAEQQMAFSQRAIGELRRQFDVSQEQMAPFIEAGTGALPGVVQGTTAEGLNERLGEIFGTDAFQNLVGERTRGVQGQLAAGGLTRSGAGLQAAAAIPQDTGLAIEALLSGRQTGLAGMGQAGAAGQAQLGAQTSGSIASLLAGQGQTAASGILGSQQARAAGTQNVMDIAGSIFGGKGGLGETLKSSVTSAAKSFFSDPDLKENIEVISHIRDLTLYEWDWIPEAKGTMIEKCGTTGFMADEVKEKYPHHVDEYGGFMVINYPELLDELGAQ